LSIGRNGARSNTAVINEKITSLKERTKISDIFSKNKNVKNDKKIIVIE